MRSLCGSVPIEPGSGRPSRGQMHQAPLAKVGVGRASSVRPWRVAAAPEHDRTFGIVTFPPHPIVSPWLQLQTERTWIRKGAEGVLQGFEEPLAVALDIDYLQLPLLVRLSVPVSGPLAGP